MSAQPMLPGPVASGVSGSFQHRHTGAIWWYASQSTATCTAIFSTLVFEAWAESLRQSMASTSAFVCVTVFAFMQLTEA